VPNIISVIATTAVFHRAFYAMRHIVYALGLSIFHAKSSAIFSVQQ